MEYPVDSKTVGVEGGGATSAISEKALPPSGSNNHAGQKTDYY